MDVVADSCMFQIIKINCHQKCFPPTGQIVLDIFYSDLLERQSRTASIPLLSAGMKK